MKIPTVEIEALCAYIEMDLENGIQTNADEWRKTINDVRDWLDEQDKQIESQPAIGSKDNPEAGRS